MSIVLNKGDGTFEAPVAYRAGSSTGTLALADLNGDGKPDVVVASRPTSHCMPATACPSTAPPVEEGVLVFLNRGNALLAAPIAYASAIKPVEVTVGDFDGDGNIDVAAANDGTADLSILLGKGNGILELSASYPSGEPLVALSPGIAAGDVNGDRKTDLAVVNRNTGSVRMLTNDGKGLFLPTSAGFNVAQAVSATMADLNGDGRDDVILPLGLMVYVFFSTDHP